MNEINDSFYLQKDYFKTHVTKSLTFRVEKLRVLKEKIKEFEKEIFDALEKDLGKSSFETYTTEIGMVYEEIDYCIKHIYSYFSKKRKRTPLMHFISRSYVMREPYGVTLVIAPWNYPFQLVMSPMVASVACGNTVIVKPSEFTPNVNNIIQIILDLTFKKEHVCMVEGGVETSNTLLELPFDYIFFTGSPKVGKIVMKAASNNLTPVTLELGGKSPVIVDKSANIELAAKRIVWGKFINAGQTCIAPDYVYVDKSKKDELIKHMIYFIKQFYSDNPIDNKNYTSIINQKHFERLSSLIDKEKIIYGGQADDLKTRIEPTILDNITWEDSVMQDEIFGPILPILTFDSLKEVLTTLEDKDKPLALYLFTTNKAVEQEVFRRLSFGGGCVNDTIIHFASTYIPFGGVGNSGMGSYHGKNSLDTFSHAKSYIKKSNLIDINLRYPSDKDNLNIIRKFLS